MGSTLVVIGVVIFVNLALWQLGRADEKRALLSAIEHGQQLTRALTADEANLRRYQRVEAHGHFESSRQFLLDNMPSAHGRPGFRVLTPFVLDGGARIMVDRGWIPLGAARNELPDITVSDTSRTITGVLDDLPRPGLRMAAAPELQATTWPQVVNFPEHALLESALGYDLLEPILMLDPTLPDGFEREWQARLNFKPERHVGYAVQWFAFAFAAVVIYLLLSFRPQNPTGDDLAKR